MFSAAQLAWMTIIPTAIAVTLTWLANRSRVRSLSRADSHDPSNEGDNNIAIDDVARNDRVGELGRGFGLAIGIAFCIATIGVQTIDNYNVAISKSTDEGISGQSAIFSAIGESLQQVVSPIVAHHRVVQFAILGLVAGLIVRLPRATVGIAVAVIASAIMVTRTLWTSAYVQSDWSRLEQVVWMGGISLLAGYLWWRISHQSSVSAESSYLRMFLLGFATFLLSATLVFTGSLTYGTVAAVLASSAGGAWLCGWRYRRIGVAGDWCTPQVLLFVFLLVIGTAFSELPTWNALLFAATVALIAILPIPAKPSFGKLAACVLIAILPSVVATGLAAKHFVDLNSSQPSNPYDAYK